MGGIENQNFRLGQNKYEANTQNKGVDLESAQKKGIKIEVFKKFDTDNNNVLDSTELNAMYQQINDATGHNSRLSKNEANAMFDGKIENARDELVKLLDFINNEDLDNVSDATQNGDGTVTVKYKDGTQEKYKPVGDAGARVLEQKIVNKNNTLITTTYEDDGVTPKEITGRLGDSATMVYDPKHPDAMTELNRKVGANITRTTTFENDYNIDGVVSGFKATYNSNEEPAKTTVYEALPVPEGATFNDDGTVTLADGKQYQLTPESPDGKKYYMISQVTTDTHHGTRVSEDFLNDEGPVEQKIDAQGNVIEEPAPEVPNKFDPGNKSWYEIVTQDYGITGRDAIYQAIGQLKAANGVTDRTKAIGPKDTMAERNFATPEITIGGKTYKINSAPAVDSEVSVPEEPVPAENESIEVPAQITGDALPAEKTPLPNLSDLKNLTNIDPNEENPRVMINGREIQLNRVYTTPEGVVQFEVDGTDNQIYLRQNNGQTIISLEDNKKNLTSLYNSEGEYFGSVEDVYTGDPAEALIPNRKVYRGKDGKVVSFCELKQDESNRTADIYNADGTFRGRVVSPFDETKPVVYYDKDGNMVDPFEVEFQGIVVDRDSA